MNDHSPTSDVGRWLAMCFAFGVVNDPGEVKVWSYVWFLVLAVLFAWAGDRANKHRG